MRLFYILSFLFLPFLVSCGGGGGGTKDFGGTWKVDVVKTYDSCSSELNVNFVNNNSYSMLVNQDGEHVIADVGNTHLEGYTHAHPEYVDIDDIVRNGFQVADIEYYRGIKAFEHFVAVVDVHGDTGEVFEDVAFAIEANGNGVWYCEVYYRGEAKRIVRNRMYSEEMTGNEPQESLLNDEIKEKIYNALDSQMD